MMEEWRDIPGYEGRYQASSLGQIRSVDRFVRCKSKAGMWFLRPINGVVLAAGRCRGYLIVNLAPDGTIAVHRLVALTFLPAPRSDQEVNHKDLDKHNNRLSNLEWATKKENQQHWRALRKAA